MMCRLAQAIVPSESAFTSELMNSLEALVGEVPDFTEKATASLDDFKAKIESETEKSKCDCEVCTSGKCNPSGNVKIEGADPEWVDLVNDLMTDPRVNIEHYTGGSFRR